ncbi:MAG: type I DNA topoisomerase [Dehalococcoidia bacterium]|nr:type I DNA topoisomerase [Dehalococcoidia bacterium]
MKKSLVIVESPAKARTLSKMLGTSYVIKASMGHVRDLPKSSLGVDVEHDFEPKYVVSRDKSQTVKDLKGAAAKAGIVYLATDPDREGEAIAWHLAQLTESGTKSFKRVVFHEITASAIKDAFAHPRELNLRMVNAQQARRILDRLVGYQISPLLWRKIRRGLSAGRVQSVAVKIVVDREREIEAFKPQEYWTIEAKLKKTKGAGPNFQATLIGFAAGGKISIPNKKMADALLEELDSAAYAVLKVTTKNTKRSPAPPFITSTLQQEAWRRHHFTAKKTMALAQQLYEGLNTGVEGEVGLITYMRTDSTHIAKEALAETREFIKSKYGAEYLPERPRVYARKVKGAQEAHEAIRPTRIDREPSNLKPYLTNDQLRLYQLIWQRMVASQMAEAVFENTAVDVEAKPKTAKNRYLLHATCSVNVFPGFIALYAEQKDDEDDKLPLASLPKLIKGEALTLLGLTPTQSFTKPPSRYTEATLIKILEQNGIGRPSTYAPILSTILDREYVIKEAGAFKPTELGELVTDLLANNFSDIVNIDYTARIEDELDKIVSDAEDWVRVVRGFYGPLEDNLSRASESIEKIELAPEVSEDICPQCNKEKLLVKVGRYGKYMECPTCIFRQSFRISTGVPCPGCPEQGMLVGRYSKKGKLFYGCDKFPKHKFALNYRPLMEPCPKCGGLLMEAGKQVRCYECSKRRGGKHNAPPPLGRQVRSASKARPASKKPSRARVGKKG